MWFPMNVLFANGLWIRREYKRMKQLVKTLLVLIFTLSTVLFPCQNAFGEDALLSLNNDINAMFNALWLMKSGLNDDAVTALKGMECYDELVQLILTAEGIAANDIIADKAAEETPAESEDQAAYTFEGEPTDLLTIEMVEIQPATVSYLKDKPEFFTWRAKVRNTSGKDLPMKESSMRVWYRYLDENEDILWSTYLTGGYKSEVKSGRAEWLEEYGFPANWSKKEFESAVNKGKIIIPVGSTGYMAKELLLIVKNNIDKYLYLKDYILALEEETDINKLIDLI